MKQRGADARMRNVQRLGELGLDQALARNHATRPDRAPQRLHRVFSASGPAEKFLLHCG
jgi:hypothetical protein